MKLLRYSTVLAISLGSIFSIAAFTSAETTTLQCPVVSSFMKQGIANDPAAVTKLQHFLKDSEKLDVDVNGTFDQKTEDAVKVFQKKYLSDILGPWGATKASGIVYITTMKKINQLACAVPLSLDQKDLTVIANYQGSSASSTVSATMPSSTMQTTPVTITATPAVQEADPVVTYTSNPVVSQNPSVTGPTLSTSALLAPGSSLISRFEYYLANLF